MIIKADLKKGTLKVGQTGKYKITCDVRNELNQRRKAFQVIRSLPEKYPVQPRPFPRGWWNITDYEYTEDPEFSPVKIKTDATQNLPVWRINQHGHYSSPSEDLTEDFCYWLHYSKNSKTTLGCIRLDSEKDALEIAGIVKKALYENKKVVLEVL